MSTKANTCFNSKHEIYTVNGENYILTVPIIINLGVNYLKLNYEFLNPTSVATGTLEIYDNDALVLSYTFQENTNNAFSEAVEKSVEISALHYGIYLMKLKFNANNLKLKYINIHTI